MNFYQAIGLTLITIILGFIPVAKLSQIRNYLISQKRNELANVISALDTIFIIVTIVLLLFTSRSWFEAINTKTPKYYNKQFDLLIKQEKEQYQIDTYIIKHNDHYKKLENFFTNEFTSVNEKTRKNWFNFFFQRCVLNNAYLDIDKIKKDLNVSNVVDITYDYDDEGYTAFTFFEKGVLKVVNSNGYTNSNCKCQRRYTDKKKEFRYAPDIILKNYE